MSQTLFIHRHHTAIKIWLMVCLLLVALMVAVGGYTRLSGSGLSITQWKPVHGTIPPMNAQEWEEEFAAYQQSPQYKKVNTGMSMGEFKTIYWPEYWHRVLGRSIGFVFLLPLIGFALLKSISRRFGLRLTAIFALGGLQGLAGWLMVASGLVDNPHVSHIRLAVHLGLAFALFALLLWALLDIAPDKRSVPASMRRWYRRWFALLCVQIIFGALVAGLKAGLIYNTWPTMNGMWFPPELFDGSQPALENIALIQFLHRKIAIIIALGFILWWYLQRKYVKKAGLIRHCTVLATILAAQFLLGVLALLHQIPLSLALAHQMVGLGLFAAAVWLTHRLSPMGEQGNEQEI